MRFQLLPLTLWLLLSALAMPSACQEHSRRPCQILADLEEEVWNWRMKDAPLFSTAVGETRHNAELESYIYAVYQQRKTTVQRFLDRLQAVDSDQLNEKEKLDYDIFADYLQTYLDGAQWNDYFALNSVNFLEGINADPSHMQMVMPLKSVEDFENYLQRLIKMPIQVDQKIGLLQMAVASGQTLNIASVIAVPSQIAAVVRKCVDESDFYQPAFTSKLDASEIPATNRSSLRTRAQVAVMNVHQALNRLKTYLEQSYLSASRGTWGLRMMKDGEEMYQQCLRYHTSTNMTSEEVHQLGLQEVARIRGEMQAALHRLNYTGTIKQFYDSIRTDPQFHKNSSEALLDTYRDYIYNRIIPKMQTIFRDIPDLPFEVQEMPYDGPGGLYMAGTPDGSVPGIFYANVMHPQDVVTIGFMSLVLHEAIPGHHLQSLYSLNATIPKYRKFMEDDNYYRMPATFPINTAYLEGWAQYCEYLGEELGLYTDDYMLMGRYSDEIFRACRLVVDTGLHTFGWGRDQAIQYMLDNTALSRWEMTTEVDRYLTWPGQATAYKIGEIKIKQLRQRAMDALGTKFQLVDFHGVVLKNGGMPLHLLERLVEHWIAKVKAAGDVTSSTSTPDDLIG